MTVRAGREFLAVPGPTNIPDEVLQAMHRPAVEIYSEPLIALTNGLLRDLGKVFATATRPYIYIANGHGAWEAALTNVLSRGDKILVLESGQFGIAWGDAAARLGVEIEVLAGDWRRAVRPADVEARLRADNGGAIKAILAVQIETSTGVANDIAAIGAAIKAARHDALYLVDAVASLGCVPFAMDAWGVDVAVSGSQKGLMSPPGLSFVAAGARARAAHRTAGLRTPYWDWTTRDGESHPARRRSNCCLRCAKPSTCYLRKGSTTSSCATVCSPRPCAAPSRCGSKATSSISTSPNRATAPMRSPPC
jgi:alanine-glyoxylate transaminase/serine-glyoxylate transaminase/serine-pyruvate transaminase